jgi:hypothetical protein
VIGNYKLDRKIGRGATSEVWLAHHAHLNDRYVAIKILMSHDEETVGRFQREAQIASFLHHPNIVQVYDHGSYQAYDPPGQYQCTLFEYIHGGSLQSLLDHHGRLPLGDTLTIMQQLAAALDYAHSHDVIHRDVSPGNVLVEQDSWRVLLTDFGIARDLNKQITVDRAVMGTPGYWSPEHMRSATEVTHLSDIYGLGVILYTILSGELPWDDGMPRRDAEPPPPLKSKGATNVPAELDRVLQTMLAFDPARRYQSAHAAVEQLERIVARHHTVTHMVTAPPDDAQGAQADPLAYDASQQDAVQTALEGMLLREPIERAHARAQQMCEPGIIAHHLNQWAARGRFRRTLLGRLARLHQISSYNIYFYQVRVLYEQRGQPEATAEPDYHNKVFPLEPEPDRWQVQLPPIQQIEEEQGGQMVVPGSARVVSCNSCKGLGKTVCPECKGKQRIYTTRDIELPATERLSAVGDAAALPQSGLAGGGKRSRRGARQNSEMPTQTVQKQVLVPCPTCEGTGGLPCAPCDGVGRMVQKRVLHWQRTGTVLHAHDEFPPNTHEKWLRRTCEEHQIYCEQAGGNIQDNLPPFLREWRSIPELKELIRQASADANDEKRVAMSEVTISFIPVTDIVFDMSDQDDDSAEDEHNPASLYRMTLYGFEDAIPSDWRFLNWERVVFLCVGGFLLILVVILGVFAFSG